MLGVDVRICDSWTETAEDGSEAGTGRHQAEGHVHSPAAVGVHDEKIDRTNNSLEDALA